MRASEPAARTLDTRTRLRIAAHNGAPIWGGAEIAVCRLLAGLQARGHEVTFFVARAEVALRARAFGLRTEPLPVGGDAALHHSVRVARALRRAGAQVLIVGTFRKLLHLAIGARMAGVPVIARIGLEGDEPRNSKYRYLFRHYVDRVVVSSDRMRRAYLAAMPELEGRVLQITKGISAPEHGSRDGARQALGIEPGAVLITSLARLVRDKRVDRFVDVVAALPGTVGLVAGEGPLRAELEAYVQYRGADVRFLGHVERVGDLLTASDLLVVTSFRESMSNAMLEAMACGVPVVSTPVDGAAEVLEAESGPAPGVVSAGFDVASILDAVRPLAHDEALRKAMGETAARRVQGRFTERAMLDGWERLLLEVTGP